MGKTQHKTRADPPQGRVLTLRKEVGEGTVKMRAPAAVEEANQG